MGVGVQVPYAQSGEALGASYRLVECIGSGAVGEVWRIAATDERDLAAKILRAEHADDVALVERFVRERSLLLALRHPNIVEVQDLVVEGNRLAIVMDYVAGGSLRDLLIRQGPLPAALAFEVAAQVLDALAAAHAAQVAHRDIKPDNILLARPWSAELEGIVRVSDFGISSVIGEKMRKTTGLLGTPQYMSPELIGQGQAGPPSDVYSTGVMLYELLAGRTPFAGPGTDFTVAYRHVSAVPPPLALPGELWAAVAVLLAKNPQDRPSAREASAKLRRLATKHANLPALEAVEPPLDFDAVERPATVVRGSQTDLQEPAEPGTHLSPELPELGAAGSETVLRPMRRRSVQEEAPQVVAQRKWWQLQTPAWATKKAVLLAAAAVTLLVVMVVGFIVIAPKAPPTGSQTGKQTINAQQQDAPLPTGLTVSRSAVYEGSSGVVTLTITYAAQKVALRGALLEVVPAGDLGPNCPTVDWQQVSAARNQPSITSVDAACGWSLNNVTIPAGGTVQVKGTLPLTVNGEQALNKWLSAAAAATTTAVGDSSVSGTSYPVQRLQGIQLKTPARTVSQSPLNVTLVPVWASGPDVINPLYISPSAGKPSELLMAVAGGEQGVRFADGCSGGLAVSTDGLVVTTLAIAPNCTLRATVGNFSDLQSPPFSITTREG